MVSEFGQDSNTPTLFEGHPGVFNDHRARTSV